MNDVRRAGSVFGYLGHVSEATSLLAKPFRFQRLNQGDQVDRLLVGCQLPHLGENHLVGADVERFWFEHRHGGLAAIATAIQHHAAQHTLFGFDVLRDHVHVGHSAFSLVFSRVSERNR